MPAPPGHRCDQTSLPARPQGATFTGQPAACSHYTAVTLNKPLDFERGGQFFKIMENYCFARNNPPCGDLHPSSASFSCPCGGGRRSWPPLGANDVLIVLSANRVINKPILYLGNHYPHLLHLEGGRARYCIQNLRQGSCETRGSGGRK
jgi:hypothetical protein